jgi:DNA polymerase-3 subunit alpha
VLFGDDYLKFKTFMNIGWFLFIEGVVARNTWGQQNLEFKFRSIELLNELGIKRSKGLQLKVNATDITPQMIGVIESVCVEFSGNTPLYVKVQDATENINLDLLSRKFRISPVNDMVKQLRKAGEIDVEVVY